MIAALLVVPLMVAALVPTLGLARPDQNSPPRPPEDVRLTWRAADDKLFHLAISRTDLAAYDAARSARLEQEGARLRGLAQAMLAHDLASLYGRMATHVPLYADWAYGWVQSYVIIYETVLKTAELVVMPEDGGDRRSLGTALTESMGSIATEHFQDIVVRPAEPGPSLVNAQARIARLLDAEWARIQRSEQQGWEDFIGQSAQVTAIDLSLPNVRASGPGTMDSCLIATHLPALAAAAIALPSDLGQNNVLGLRIARPAAFAAVRLGIGGPVAASGTVLIFSALTGSVSALGTIAVSASLWFADYLASWLDAAFFRSDFEARLLRSLEAARLDQQRALAGGLDDGIATALRELADCQDRRRAMPARR